MQRLKHVKTTFNAVSTLDYMKGKGVLMERTIFFTLSLFSGDRINIDVKLIDKVNLGQL